MWMRMKMTPHPQPAKAELKYSRAAARTEPASLNKNLSHNKPGEVRFNFIDDCFDRLSVAVPTPIWDRDFVLPVKSRPGGVKPL